MRIILSVCVLALSSVVAAFRYVRPNNVLRRQMSSSACAEKITVPVELQSRSYEISIGHDLLTNSDLLRRTVGNRKALVVTNTVVAPLYLDRVMQSLQNDGVEANQVILPDGEAHKNLDVLTRIIDAAMEAKLDRKDVMIALGGGVVGDMCGFAASIYQRGIKFIQVPTTLMAMVDSSVGGKTAANHPMGKNMIGTFYQPIAVIADLSTLDTLPDREFCSGLAEVVKYGLIRDRELFCWLEGNMERVVSRDVDALSHIVKRCCELKAAIVAADETEDSPAGTRATLNLGHTFGHAIEAGLGYGTLLHGEAVAIGTMMAAELSQRMGWIDSDLLVRLRALLQRARLPTTFRHESEGSHPQSRTTTSSHTNTQTQSSTHTSSPPSLTGEVFLQLMGRDKKVSGGQLNLVLQKGPLGCAVLTSDFDPQLLRQVVAEYCGS